MIFSVPRPHVIQPVSTFACNATPTFVKMKSLNFYFMVFNMLHSAFGPFLITHGNANSVVVVVVVDCTAPVQHALRSTRFSHNSAAWAS